MFHELRGYLFCCPPTAIDSFDSFNIVELVDFLLTSPFSSTYVWHDLWHGSCFGQGCDGSIVELELTNLEVMWYEDYSFFGRQSRGCHGCKPRRRRRYCNAAWVSRVRRST